MEKPWQLYSSSSSPHRVRRKPVPQLSSASSSASSVTTIPEYRLFAQQLQIQQQQQSPGTMVDTHLLHSSPYDHGDDYEARHSLDWSISDLDSSCYSPGGRAYEPSKASFEIYQDADAGSDRDRYDYSYRGHD